jgi:hypothetical protein
VRAAVPAEPIVDDAAEAVEVVDRRKQLWMWAACIGVVLFATAGTVALLLLQWMSSGSSTVAR